MAEGTDRMPQRKNQYDEIPALKTMLMNLKEIPSVRWADYAFSREILREKISPEQRKVMEKDAYDCAVRYAKQFREQFPEESVLQIAEKLGLLIQHDRSQSCGVWTVFAEFRPPDTIVLYDDCIEKAALLLADMEISQLLQNVNLGEVLTAHEIFHWIEMRDEKFIPTRVAKVAVYPHFLFKNYSTPRYLGEIAGMEFARKMLGLNYCPFLLDIFLTYACNKEKASDMYLEIMG